MRLVVVCIVGILLLFLVVQLVGSPISQFGSTTFSIVYSLGVYLPVIVVCALALRRVSKGT